MAELKPLDHLDGNSLSPLMLGKQQKVKDFAVSQYLDVILWDIVLELQIIAIHYG